MSDFTSTIVVIAAAFIPLFLIYSLINWRKWQFKVRWYWGRWAVRTRYFFWISLNSERRKLVREIPWGFYCYDLVTKKVCPYWALDALHPENKFPQECGYCTFLHKSDFDIRTQKKYYSGLWTKDKECYIRYIDTSEDA